MTKSHRLEHGVVEWAVGSHDAGDVCAEAGTLTEV